MASVSNTLSYDVETALKTVAGVYFPTCLSFFAQLSLQQGQTPNILKFPQVVFYCLDTTEEVFQTGIFRAKCEIKMRVDLDNPLAIGETAEQQIHDLSAAIQDIWEITDLTTQLTNTGLIVAKLVIPGEASTVELGDRYAREQSEGK